MTQMTGGELLLKCLKEEGINVLFGVLDGSFNPFLAKLKEYDMHYICPRHEAAAVHMAEAWARIRGEPAVVVGGIGPGAANMVSGVVTAYAEGSPVIAITGQRRRNIIYPDRGGAFQNVDLLGMYSPVTKWSAGVRQWRRLPELLRQAFRVATNGRPGPVYVEIPEDVMRGTGDPESVAVWPSAQYRVNKAGVGDPALIAQAAQILAQAKRPLLHAGAGVSWSGGWEEFVALGDHLAATLTTTLGARGVVPEDHPRYIHMLDRKPLEAARADADVVLVVGARLGELDGWGRPPVWGAPGTQKTIQVDADPTSIGLNRPVDLGILGDAKAVLAALLDAVKEITGPEPRKEHDGFAQYREMAKELEAQKSDALKMGSGQINSGRMVQVVRDFFPRDAITVMDGGNTSLWCASFNPIYEARSYLYTAKFGHLGTGLPYAMGAKLAAPDRQVYLITGDGALGFNIQELETARRHDIRITVVVACDRGWGMERSSQMLGGVGSLIETEHYADVRYDQVAQAFGCYGEKVDELDQLQPALERAAASEKPALIQVMVDQHANLAPPGALVFGAMVYRSED